MAVSGQVRGAMIGGRENPSGQLDHRALFCTIVPLTRRLRRHPPDGRGTPAQPSVEAPGSGRLVKMLVDKAPSALSDSMRSARRSGGIAVRTIVRLVVAALLVGVATVRSPGDEIGKSPAAPTQAQPTEPPNIGDAKRAAINYHDSGAYDRDLRTVTAGAGNWLLERARQVNRPAMVLDIDDTALSNWSVIVANDFGRVFGGPCEDLPKGPCGWVAWDLLSRSPTIPATLALFKQARALSVTVFFITGRDEPQRGATERNLREAGYADHAGLYMPAEGARYGSAADFKAPQRAAIEASGYTIIANVGDQPSDLAGGHAERTFLLPNPFYRVW